MKPASASTRRPAVGFRSGTIPVANPSRAGVTEGPVEGAAAATANEAVEPEIVLSDDRGQGEEAALTPVGQGVEGIKKSPFRKREAVEDRPRRKEVAAEMPEKPKRSWMFWRRPSKRTQELTEMRKGCEKIEQVVGEIRSQLETAEKDRVVLNKTLSPLPLAVDGLKRVGENQEETNVILKKVGDSLDRGEEKDKVFFNTMDRMGDTMSNMDMTVVGMGRAFSSIERTSKQSVDTMQRLSERLTESDRFLKETFDRLREAEREYGDHMRTNARRSAMVTITLCALMTLGIAVLAHTLGGASHNVTVMRPHVPGPLTSPTIALPASDPDPGPVEWREPADQWPGMAGEAPAGDLSEIPLPVELPERFEALSFPVTTPAGH